MLFFVFLFFHLNLYAAFWNPTPPERISNFTTQYLISSALSPNVGQFLSVYQGNGDGPFYSLYTERTESWQTGLLPAVNINPIFCSYGNGIDLIISANNGISGRYPNGVFYTLFDGSTFTFSPLPIPGSSNTEPVGYPSYNSFSNQFLVTWLDTTNSPPVPYFSVFDGSNWTTGTNVPGTIGNEADFVVLSTANSQNGDFLITWLSLTDNLAYFSFGPPSSLSSAQAIPGSGQAQYVIFPSFDPNSGGYIVTWIDSMSSLPTYTTFDGSSWLPPVPIPGAPPCDYNAGTPSSLDSVSGTLFFGLVTEGPNSIPTYLTYNSTLVNPWSSPAAIPGSIAASSAVFSAFDPANKMFLTAWIGSLSSLPTFSTYSLKEESTITLTTSPNPSEWTQKVTLTAQVSPTGATGFVTFYVNGVKVGKAPLISGTATLKVTMTCEGDSTVEAIYSGDAVFASSLATAIHTVECFKW